MKSQTLPAWKELRKVFRQGGQKCEPSIMWRNDFQDLPPRIWLSWRQDRARLAEDSAGRMLAIDMIISGGRRRRLDTVADASKSLPGQIIDMSLLQGTASKVIAR